jgi:RnfABCDGE-type electron transport complex B subunit
MLYALICMGGLGLLFGIGLAIASKIFSVKTDPRVDAMLEVLPGANCGGCGFAGCSAYASAVAAGKAEFDHCAPGGKEVAEKICAIMGQEMGAFEKNVAYLRCQGHSSFETDYNGPKTCAAAAIPAQGPYSCKFSCLKLGDCVKACQFGAISINIGELPVIDTDICGGCGGCMRACPKKVIAVGPLSRSIQVGCVSQDKPVVKRKFCQTACIGCQKCLKNCPAGAITMEGAVAVIDKGKCTMCSLCLQNCPTKAILNFMPGKEEPAAEAQEAASGQQQA